MLRRLLSFTFILGFSFGLFAQSNLPDSVKFSLKNPLSTVYTHLHFLQAETYNAERAAQTLNMQDAEQAKNLAIKLKQVLDGRGMYVDIDIIPTENNYTDTTTGLNRYVLFQKLPEVYVERINGKWLYSKRTVEAIPSLHKEVYPFGSDVLMNMFPKVGQKQFLGLALWQYFGILVIVIITILIHQLLSWVVGLIINYLIKSPKVAKEQRLIIQKAAHPISLMVLTMLLELQVPILQLPIVTAKYIVLILDILTPVYATIAVYRLVDLAAIYMWKRAEKTESNLDDQLVPLLGKILKIFVVLSGAIVVLSVLDVDVTALLAGISIGGLAFALAAQDTIKNLFGSLMIFIDKPFQIGDWINFKGVDGTVEEVGFRSTRVRTFANSLVSVPNGEIANMVVDNLGLRVYRRYSTKISITYDTPPALIEKYVEGLRDIVKNHPMTRKDYYEIHMNEMGAASLNILFYIFFNVPDWSQELKGRHEIIMETMKLADELGIRFAFPTQTLHIEDFPGQSSLSPQYKLDQEEMNSKVAVFMEGYKERYSERKD